LIMTSSFARLDPRGLRILENWRNSVCYCGWAQFCRELLAHFFTAEYFEQNPEGVARAERALIETRRTIHGYMRTSEAVESHDTWNRIGSIAVPTLLMCGAEDLVTPPRQSEAMASRIPGAKVQIVPRSLHGFLAERPESLDTVLAFLRRN
jgi:3-oxoadipate enol-lactonase